MLNFPKRKSLEKHALKSSIDCPKPHKTRVYSYVKTTPLQSLLSSGTIGKLRKSTAYIHTYVGFDVSSFVVLINPVTILIIFFSLYSRSRISFFNLQTDSEVHNYNNRLWARRRLRIVASMLNLFNLKRLSWKDTNGQQKVVLSATEVESLRSELADLEEREAHLKARLEHIDETLRCARLSGYLQMRTRWEPLPGEPPALDDSDVDDWRPFFVVLQGPIIFLYSTSTDISPQDSTLLSDVVEVGCMPCHTQEDGEIRYYFYIVTRRGLRYECSSASKFQVDAWVTTLQDECKLGSDSITLES
ncbi:putative pleckstrin domain, PH-like domain superfamily [Helianthus annuus]|nr:putative pleckstrin domain, PH-like domain superfamily [Helianthus annuus]KAJ0769419.1 putative pleckstrin domain, PH-like domain superfamily [Helianthus annuus]